MRLYTQQEAIERMNHFGKARRPFIFVVNYLQDASYIEETSAVDPAELLYNFNGFTNQPPAEGHPVSFLSPFEWESFPQSFDEYQHSFDLVQKNIFAGNSFLANLTCRTPIKTTLTLNEIFSRSQALYKLWLKDTFVVFSPEIFVRIHQGRIYSYPMKGTIDASLPMAAQRLIDDPKEAAEHATIVDLIRNDLSMVAEQVTVSRYRYIDSLHTHKGAMLQTSSEIQGVLPLDYQERVGSILFALLPAGSITGAPKRKTMQIIRRAETHNRGFYTGVMGSFDGSNLDSSVMIRFVEQQAEGGMCYKSGGGVTCRSDAQSEYNEMIQKIYVPIY